MDEVEDELLGEMDATEYINREKTGEDIYYPIVNPFPYILNSLKEKFERGIAES